MRKLERISTSYAAPAALTAGLAVTAGNLTTAFSGNRSTAKDTQLTDEAPTTACFDQLFLLVTPTIGSAGRIKLRLEESIDDSTYGWIMDGDQIWERTFDATLSGETFWLPIVNLTMRYFRLSAAYEDGSATGAALTVNYGLGHSNTGITPESIGKPDVSSYSRILKAYGALTGGTTWDQFSMKTKNQKFCRFVVYYVEGVVAADNGKVDIDVKKIDTVSDEDYGARDSAVDRPRIVAGGGTLSTDIQHEKFVFEPEDLNYTLTGGSWSTDTATITIGAHAIRVGDRICVAGVNETGYNGTFLEVTAIAATTVSYAVAANPGAWTSGGTVQVMESIELEYDNAARYDEIEIGLLESGDTSNPGNIVVMGKTTRM